LRLRPRSLFGILQLDPSETEADKMSRIYIQFQSEDDEVNGVYALATQSRADSIGNIFRVSDADLQLLDNKQVKYTFASEREILDAYQRLHEFRNGKPRAGIKSKFVKLKRWIPFNS
jgi:hypothetical protein